MKISRTVLKLPSGYEYMTGITIYTVQKAITPKVGKPHLWFLFSTHCLMVLNISVKVCENLNSFQVTDWTWVYDQNHDLPCSKDNSKSR